MTTGENGILEAIEHDLTLYEKGEGEGFIFLVCFDGDMFVPVEWIKDYPQWEEQWGKFMNGQTMCAGGFFVRDITRFLRAVRK